MASISRRKLFGLLGGVAAAPLIRAFPAVEPSIVIAKLEFAGPEAFRYYSGYETLTITGIRNELIGLVPSGFKAWDD